MEFPAPSLYNLEAWLKTKSPNTQYDFDKAKTCAVSTYLDEVYPQRADKTHEDKARSKAAAEAIAHLHGGHTGFFPGSTDAERLTSYHTLMNQKPYTYQGVLDRIRAYKESL